MDSAKKNEVIKAMAFGWVRGVTTNPSLLAKVDHPPEVVLEQLSSISTGPLFYQLMVKTPHEMLREANKARDLVGEKLVLKILPSEAGFRFCAQYSGDFPCCVTAVFSEWQALVAREAEAAYIAIYVNRATRLLGDGIELVKNASAVLSGSSTQIVAASIKSPLEASAVFMAGAHHLAVPYDVLQKLITHELSERAIAEFYGSGVGIDI
ncbi:transaldolase family protein [Chloroflexota bacterium]